MPIGRAEISGVPGKRSINKKAAPKEGRAQRHGIERGVQHPRRGIALVGERVLDRLLAHHHRGIVVRAQHAEHERPREAGRRAAQANGVDLGVEAAGERHRWLGELQARLTEHPAQVSDEAARDLVSARHRRRA